MKSLPQHDCFDIIGDIHGYAEQLEALLRKLGYEPVAGIYRHRDRNRKVIFVGDFIDRGPDILRVLKIVRSMLDAGEAFAVIGNHEFNAIAYGTKHNGRYLRTHDEDHIKQHQETLDQIGDGEQIAETWREWFRTLPLSLGNDELRIVHACWDSWALEIAHAALVRHGGMNDAFMIEALPPRSERGDLYLAIEWLLKGKEVKLKKGMEPIADAGGKKRRKIRVRWFDLPSSPTYANMIYPPVPGFDCHEPVQLPQAMKDSVYPVDAIPVFFGHYWLTGEPTPPKSNTVCLDYSVAREGCLVAFTWRKGIPLAQGRFTTEC